MESKALERYLRRLKGALTCSRPDRERLLSQGRQLLADFLGENPESGYEALITAFGPPEVFAGEMLSTLDQEALEQTWTRRVWLRRGIAALIVAGLILIAVFWYLRWNRLHGQINDLYYSVPGEAITVTPEEYKGIFGVYPKGTN